MEDGVSGELGPHVQSPAALVRNRPSEHVTTRCLKMADVIVAKMDQKVRKQNSAQIHHA